MKTPGTSIDKEKEKATAEKKEGQGVPFPTINNYMTISAPGMNQDKMVTDITKKMNEAIENYGRDPRFVMGRPPGQ